MGTTGDGSKRYLGDEGDRKRFWSKVSKFGDEGCWLWTAGTFATGYGAFAMNGTTWLAHRLAYTWEYGHIPEGLVLDHLVCSTRRCVNPRHLKAMTHQENAGRETRQTPLPCLTPGCAGVAKSARLGICNSCYRKQRREEETRTCSVAGCTARWHARDLCSKHYEEDRARQGLIGERKRRSTDALKNLRERTSVDSVSGCWYWMGGIKNGYGFVHYTKPDGTRGQKAAHRAVWEELRGLIPEGYVLDHAVCGNKLCCNPDHLEPVTVQENSARFSRSRAGLPRQTRTSGMSVDERIDESLDRSGADGHWLWTGSTDSRGLPYLGLRTAAGGVSRMSVRRYLWTAARGPIPRGQQLVDRCGRRDCCNPEHLVLQAKPDSSRYRPRPTGKPRSRSRRRRFA